MCATGSTSTIIAVRSTLCCSAAARCATSTWQNSSCARWAAPRISSCLSPTVRGTTCATPSTARRPAANWAGKRRSVSRTAWRKPSRGTASIGRGLTTCAPGNIATISRSTTYNAPRPSHNKTGLQQVTQLAAQNFSRCSSGKRPHEVHLPRHFVMRQALGDERLQAGSRFVGLEFCFAQNYKCTRNLFSLLVGAPHYATVAHRGMLQQHGFNFSRRNGESLVLDHFFAAIDDVIESQFVGAHNVT